MVTKNQGDDHFSMLTEYADFSAEGNSLKTCNFTRLAILK